jgi:hypothetical protein
MSRSPALSASAIADLYLDAEERVHLVADSPKLHFAVYTHALVLDGSTLYLRNGGPRRPGVRSRLLRDVPEELAARVAALGAERVNRPVVESPRWRKGAFPCSYFAGYCDRDLLGEVHRDFGVVAVQEYADAPDWLTYLVVDIASGFCVASFSRKAWARGPWSGSTASPTAPARSSLRPRSPSS